MNDEELSYGKRENLSYNLKTKLGDEDHGWDGKSKLSFYSPMIRNIEDQRSKGISYSRKDSPIAKYNRNLLYHEEPETTIGQRISPEERRKLLELYSKMKN